jgi:chromosome partitioning protein
MATTIAVFNQAGGVGKTTLVHNLGYHLSLQGRVLLVDMDPQASLTNFVGLVSSEIEETIYTSLVQKKALPIENGIWQRAAIVPSNIHLCAAEIEMSAEILRELKLKKLLETVQSQFDFIVLDCPPSLGLLSILSLVAANYILVPVHSQFKAFLGTDQLLQTIVRVREAANPELEIAGFVPTLYDRRTLQDYRMLTGIKDQLGQVAFVFEPVPRAVAFADAAETRLPLAQYKPSHPAVKVLESITQQLVKLVKGGNCGQESA